MSERQKVSLYIPCYNGEEHIAACIEGVLISERLQKPLPACALIFRDLPATAPSPSSGSWPPPRCAQVGILL